MNPYYADDRATVLHGDCLALMAAMPDASFDAIVTDPPYGLGFMGKAWDSLPPGIEWAAECLRVLKPGGHLLAFGGSRTWHRLACAVEDAGFEIRDSIAWLYGSGFPKSLDVSKAIDKRREEDREPRVRVTSWVADECARLGWTRPRLCEAFGVKNQPIQSWTERNPAHAVIPTWENWQRLKALVGFGDEMDAEVWRLNGRKGAHGEAWQNAEVTAIRENAMSNWSMDGDTKFVTREDKAPATPDAERWQGWGTALKPAFEPVVMARKPLVGTVAANVLAFGTGALNIDGGRVASSEELRRPFGSPSEHVGQLKNLTPGELNPGNPAGRWPANVALDESQAEALDEQSGTLGTDKGGASRFFYVAKAPQSERPKVNGIAHPTVKPLTFMQWLIRLVTPPGGLVLDPFAGSGTTVEAALRERVRITAIEREADYLPLILHRIERHEDAPEPEPSLFDLEQPA